MSEANIIEFDDLMKVDLRTAKVLACREHPNADKLMILDVDLGTEQRQIVAGIKGHYTPEEVVGHTIIVVSNLKPRKMRGEESQGMLLAATSEDHARIILLTCDKQVQPGLRVS